MKKLETRLSIDSNFNLKSFFWTNEFIGFLEQEMDRLRNIC